MTDDVLAGNPHADRFGNPGAGTSTPNPRPAPRPAPAFPPGSLLARWEAANGTGRCGERQLAAGLQGRPDRRPAGGRRRKEPWTWSSTVSSSAAGRTAPGDFGLENRAFRVNRQSAPRVLAPGGGDGPGPDPALFGKYAGRRGRAVPGSLCVRCSSVVQIRVPAELAAGAVGLGGDGESFTRGDRRRGKRAG